MHPGAGLPSVRTDGTHGIRFGWTGVDPHSWLSVAAASGLAIAVALAVFGMPPVSIHSPLHFAGIMDPFCGMTRGTAATIRGDLIEAVRFNPASPLVPLGGIAVLGRWMHGRRTGRWLTVVGRPGPLTVAVAMVLVVALWANQQAHAELLM